MCDRLAPEGSSAENSTANADPLGGQVQEDSPESPDESDKGDLLESEFPNSPSSQDDDGNPGFLLPDSVIPPLEQNSEDGTNSSLVEPSGSIEPPFMPPFALSSEGFQELQENLQLSSSSSDFSLPPISEEVEASSNPLSDKNLAQTIFTILELVGGRNHLALAAMQQALDDIDRERRNFRERISRSTTLLTRSTRVTHCCHLVMKNRKTSTFDDAEFEIYLERIRQRYQSELETLGRNRKQINESLHKETARKIVLDKIVDLLVKSVSGNLRPQHVEQSPSTSTPPPNVYNAADAEYMASQLSREILDTPEKPPNCDEMEGSSEEICNSPESVTSDSTTIRWSPQSPQDNALDDECINEFEDAEFYFDDEAVRKKHSTPLDQQKHETFRPLSPHSPPGSPPRYNLNRQSAQTSAAQTSNRKGPKTPPLPIAGSSEAKSLGKSRIPAVNVAGSRKARSQNKKCPGGGQTLKEPMKSSIAVLEFTIPPPSQQVKRVRTCGHICTSPSPTLARNDSEASSKQLRERESTQARSVSSAPPKDKTKIKILIGPSLNSRTPPLPIDFYGPLLLAPPEPKTSPPKRRHGRKTVRVRRPIVNISEELNRRLGIGRERCESGETTQNQPVNQAQTEIQDQPRLQDQPRVQDQPMVPQSSTGAIPKTQPAADHVFKTPFIPKRHAGAIPKTHLNTSKPKQQTEQIPQQMPKPDFRRESLQNLEQQLRELSIRIKDCFDAKDDEVKDRALKRADEFVESADRIKEFLKKCDKHEKARIQNASKSKTKVAQALTQEQTASQEQPETTDPTFNQCVDDLRMDSIVDVLGFTDLQIYLVISMILEYVPPLTFRQRFYLSDGAAAELNFVREITLIRRQLLEQANLFDDSDHNEAVARTTARALVQLMALLLDMAWTKENDTYSYQETDV